MRSEVQREDYETKSGGTGITVAHFMCHVPVVTMKCVRTDSRKDSPDELIYIQ